MNFAYCICPSAATSPLGDIDDLVMRVLGRDANIILDDYNILMENYSRQLSNNNATSYSLFEKIILKQQAKVIKSKFTPPSSFNIDENIEPATIVDITNKAQTVRAKSIICRDDSTFSNLEDEIFKSRISVITTEDEICTDFPDFRVHIDPARLSAHLSNCIRTMCDRDTLRRVSEDECNDQIRDMMGCCGYLIKDQTRRGVSNRGYSAGEVDLIVECGKEPYAIIEGLILDSVNQANITTHVTKALTKYDNLGLRDFFILVYYRGRNFNDFSSRYYDFISTLTPLTGNINSPVDMTEHTLSDIIYTGYREIKSLGIRRDEQIICTHMLIDQG
ncbi:hypothetical protein ACQXXB_10110 [Aeromonas veronii]|uniref:hypothetical protein n=1 Tax=Aeromonas veronii TaxID=654 RepID=UPI003D23F33A|nr:hypothetical protein [Aeromonas veronii]